LRAVRQFEPEWADFYHNDKIILSFMAEQNKYSQYLLQECAVHGLKYFDVSEDFAGTVGTDCHYLIGNLRGTHVYD
jgi:hypothetical protein